MSQNSDPTEGRPERRADQSDAAGADGGPRIQRQGAGPQDGKPNPQQRPGAAAMAARRAAAEQAAGGDEVRPFTARPMQAARAARIGGQQQGAGPFKARPMQMRAAAPPAAPAAATPAAAGATPAAAGALAPRPAGQQQVARPASPPPAAPAQPVRSPVHAAAPRRRHWMLLASFIAVVILPSLIAAWYLWNRATDQYVSSLGFSVRQEDAQPSIDLLGGLAALGGGSGGASDTDILYQYIRSADMVEKVDEQLDLRDKFSQQWPNDFVFAYDPDGTIEDLTDFWQRQVQIYYDSATGLITLNVSAFTPQDARDIAQAILEESTDKINELSSVAREDATRMAREELEKSRVELTLARQAMTAYRMETQIVDPQADLAGQMGILSGLQAQLAEQMVQHDLLLDNNVRADDNRVIQSQKKIDALQNLIARERAKFGEEGHGPGGESYAQLVAEYEKLAVDREFAEAAYRGARIAYRSALVEAQRQSRYLAPHITPRVARASTQPQRLRLLALTAGLLLIGWSIMTLVYYSVRDRG
ncbi:capsule biosynthesis protein [Paracoccus sp. DMF-8]|uniref:capsule biosynthesis protein n=1 Tax=Paracoccus sp. DMF-8 TaxID=3019445 RepID=UPI0023E7F8C4|nr:capsule biosynthesis protein [Paracoccus sp. DMF-8]MDF3606847.1 capsule biosynthesis protein [Paracoccus sp. DMF-8]